PNPKPTPSHLTPPHLTRRNDMDDITPLNLDDHPKLFGMRYDQLIACLGSLIISSQLYSWLDPVMMFGQDLRLDFSIFLALLGPMYCLVTLNKSAGHWE